MRVKPHRIRRRSLAFFMAVSVNRRQVLKGPMIKLEVREPNENAWNAVGLSGT